MTEDKLLKALTLKDDINRTANGLDTIQNLFDEWDRLHAKNEHEWETLFVDKKKEWEQISLMAEQFDSVREAVIRETLHVLRHKQHELRQALNDYQKQFSKL